MAEVESYPGELEETELSIPEFIDNDSALCEAETDDEAGTAKVFVEVT